jgi:xylulokinase
MEAEAKTGKPAYAAMDEAASQVPAGCSGMFFHPYLQGEITPYSDTKLRASFTGVTSMHTKAHFTRAVMEGVAFSLKQSVQVLEGLDIRFTEPLRIIGGGAKSQLWRQIVADVLGMPLQRMHSDDSSIGSAMLAGVATGIFSSYEDSVNKCSRTGEMVFPKEENREVYEKNFVIYAKIAEALKDIYHLL